VSKRSKYETKHGNRGMDKEGRLDSGNNDMKGEVGIIIRGL